MTLTSPALPWVLGGVALVLFVALVVGRPHLRRAWPRFATRAALLAGLNALVVLTVLAVLNDQYVFYTDWADLFGGPGTATSATHGASAAAALGATARGAGLADVAGTRSYALPSPGSRIQTYAVPDGTAGHRATVIVDLPVGYDPASSRTYPVLVALHGFPGQPLSMLHLPFDSDVDQLTAAHALAPSIVVIPQIDDPRPVDTECVDGPAGSPQTDTWLGRLLPDWVVRHLHARTDRSSWATAGYSYGGWCAASVAMRHPAVYGAAISLEGYFEPDFAAGQDPLRPAALRGYDLIRMASHAPPPVAVWAFASRQDSLAYPTTARFVAAARPPLSVTAVIVPTGGHRTDVYAPHIPDALAWLARTLRGFAP